MNNLGFYKEENVFSQYECESLIQSIPLLEYKRNIAGIRHLMSNQLIFRLANDTRLLAIAAKSLGKSPIPYKATFFNKTSKDNWLVPWHQDTALPMEQRFEDSAWGPWSRKGGINYAHAPTNVLACIIALRIHLDASTSDNGPLKVIPGSHKLGVLPECEVVNYANSQNYVECNVKRGGVLAMSPLLIHASSKALSNEPRRVLHIEYTDSLEITDNIKMAVA